MPSEANTLPKSEDLIGHTITYEKIPTVIHSNSKKASQWVAHEIAALIKSKQQNGEKCVLGLATGSSPKTVYAELVRLHREEGLSFYNVICFNLDEYYPMQPGSIHSYHRFMKEQLFDHIDIAEGNFFYPGRRYPDK